MAPPVASGYGQVKAGRLPCHKVKGDGVPRRDGVQKQEFLRVVDA